MHIDVATLERFQVAAYVTAGADQSIVGFLLNAIPNTIVGAFANGDILQVLMFSVIFGFASSPGVPTASRCWTSSIASPT